MTHEAHCTANRFRAMEYVTPSDETQICKKKGDCGVEVLDTLIDAQFPSASIVLLKISKRVSMITR